MKEFNDSLQSLSQKYQDTHAVLMQINTEISDLVTPSIITNLYEDFLKTIKLTQNKKDIIENLLNGVKYVVFDFNMINESNSFFMRFAHTTSVIPAFKHNEIYLPYLNTDQMSEYVSEYLEFSLCHITEIGINHFYIDLEKTLLNFKKNTSVFNNHQLLLPKKTSFKVDNKLNFVNQYYLICNYLKETIKTHNTSKYAFIVNFDSKLSKFNLKIVDPKQFENFDFLFFVEDEKNIKEYSNLLFKEEGKSTVIDTERTLIKIKLFNDMKHF